MSAILSPCGNHRLRLDRDVQPSGFVYAYFGINPSTADATVNDATVRKWLGFTRRFGGSRFIVGNVSSVRSTDVRALRDILVSPADWQRNIDMLVNIAKEADVLVPCWGDQRKAPCHMQQDFDTVLAILRGSYRPVMTFGFTKEGYPRHPLMLGYDTPLTPWTHQPLRDK